MSDVRVAAFDHAIQEGESELVRIEISEIRDAHYATVVKLARELGIRIKPSLFRGAIEESQIELARRRDAEREVRGG